MISNSTTTAEVLPRLDHNFDLISFTGTSMRVWRKVTAPRPAALENDYEEVRAESFEDGDKSEDY